jgi:4-amino-4-deoxy-L-arabinose transferase-like glycosyltransferase
MDFKKSFWWLTAILLLVVVFSFLNLPMVVNAAKYAQVSREILSGGDWINLTIAGDAYEQKPPLLFWIGAIFFGIFGVSTLVWKIAVFLVSLIGIYSTYKLGKLLYGETAGRLAAFFWACSLSYLYFHNDIHTDTLLADFVIFSIWQLAAFFKDRRTLNFYLGIVGVGLAMLSKGPVGLAIPALAVGLHLLCHRKWKDIFNSRWLVAALIIAVMLIPALWGLFNQFGADGIRFYFWTNNMGRITGSYYGKNTDYFYYLHTTLYMLAPYTIFALFGLFFLCKKFFRTRGKISTEDEFYTIGGILPYLAVLTVSKTKNPHYMMAAVPLFMIIAAWFVVKLYSNGFSEGLKKIISGLNVLVISVFWIITGLFVFWFFPEKNWLYWLFIVLFGATGIYFFLTNSGLNRQISLLTLTILAFMFSLNFSFYPKVAKYHAPFEAVKIYNEKALPQEEIHLYKRGGRYWEILFYARKPGRYFETTDDLPALLNEQHDWIFADREGKDEILNKLPDTQVIKEFSHRSMSQMTPRFLMPGTRASKLEKRYLLKMP